MTRGAFYHHLADAIAVNRRRQPFYAARTEGRSRALSTALIAMECLLLPFAALVDGWARRFQRRGISIVEADFGSMDDIPPPETPPAYRGTVHVARQKRLRRMLRQSRRQIIARAWQQDFAAADAAATALLHNAERCEAAWKAHFAMTRHLAESVTLSARHAPGYAVQSGGATKALSRVMIVSQALLLPQALRLDLRAQALHRRYGAGILVNDLPSVLTAGWGAHNRSARFGRKEHPALYVD